MVGLALLTQALFKLFPGPGASFRCHVLLHRPRVQSPIHHAPLPRHVSLTLRVVRYLCIDKLRLRKPTSNEDLDQLESDSPHSKPAAELMKKQLSAWLSSAIERLKEPYRSLIILADLQQRSIKEVANTLDLNENQAKVYIHRGRKQLRVLLQGVEL